jgi:hypothetical protein
MVKINLLTQKKCDESLLIAQENSICHPIVVFWGGGIQFNNLYHPSGMANPKKSPPNFVGDQMSWSTSLFIFHGQPKIIYANHGQPKLVLFMGDIGNDP